jgi:hypothetical protein
VPSGVGVADGVGVGFAIVTVNFEYQVLPWPIGLQPLTLGPRSLKMSCTPKVTVPACIARNVATPSCCFLG